MPRPGPRPYECVRRAWHSDRHQPMRGSIIQQIFRVVHESHTAGTKKNREWQEKLPLVVLKSEEIMYSKANSEAEYMDPETLWDRVNDAINTIIRKDESMETGDLLPPCVEAALNLGCVPVRASRSQRNSNPRSYLSPRTQDSGAIPPILDNATNARNPNLENIERPMPMAQMQANRSVTQNYKNSPSASGNFASSSEKFPLPGNNRFVSGESKASVDMGSAYPLYYGVHSQPEGSPMGFHNPKRSNAIIVGTPIFQAISEPQEKVCLQNLFHGHGDENASNRITQSDFRINHEKEPESKEFDLSLRLGLLSEPCLRKGEISTSNNHVVGPSSQERSPQSKEFSFFPVPSTANESLDRRGWSFESEGQNVDVAVRKRKADNNLKDGQFLWQLESTSNQMKRRELPAS